MRFPKNEMRRINSKAFRNWYETEHASGLIANQDEVAKVSECYSSGCNLFRCADRGELPERAIREITFYYDLDEHSFDAYRNPNTQVEKRKEQSKTGLEYTQVTIRIETAVAQKAVELRALYGLDQFGELFTRLVEDDHARQAENLLVMRYEKMSKEDLIKELLKRNA